MSEGRCLRCKTVPLAALDSSPGSRFFECPCCHRQYERRPGTGLLFRWLHPITVILYRLIYRPQFGSQAEVIAAEFVRHRPAAEVQSMVDELRLELNDPTHQVRDYFACADSEAELRHFLRDFVAEIEKLRDGRATGRADVAGGD